VNSIKFGDTQAAVTGVDVDISLKFGATLSSANYILLTFSSEFIRNDAGTITCADFTTGTEVTKTCTTTDSSKILSTV
jgi:hypothetical protein